MWLCIALLQMCGDWLFFRCYASIDQAVGVPPQYPDDPFYRHGEQGKRNPPSEHVSSYILQLFSPL